MGKSSRVQHEGIVKSISTQTLEVSIISHSACSVVMLKVPAELPI